MADQKQFNGTVNFNGAANLKGETTITGKLVSPYASVTTTHALTADMSGETIFWTKAGGFHITLPAPAAGLYYKVVIVAGTDNSHKIKVATEGTHYFFGNVSVISNTDDKTAQQNVTKATAAGAIDDHDGLEFKSNTATLGGQAGDVIEIWGIDAASWLVSANLSTNAANPGSIATICAA